MKQSNIHGRKRIVIASLLGLALIEGNAEAATITIGAATPSAGDGVQNLTGAADSSNNTKILYSLSNYLAGDNNGVLGQTFTTGPSPDGYYLTSISFQQVPYSTSWWTGGTLGYRVFKTTSLPASGVQGMAVLASGSGTVPSMASGLQRGAPGLNAYWVTIEMPPSSPLLLEPNTQYGFDIQALGTTDSGPFVMELNGKHADVFSGGQAIIDGVPSDPDPGAVWLGNGPADGDRVFVAAMTAALPAPPLLLQVEVQAGSFSITASHTQSERWYWLQYTDSLVPADWQNAWAGPLLAVNTNLLIEGLGASVGNCRFYRVQENNPRFAIGSHGLTSLKPEGYGSDTNYTATEFIAAGYQLGNASLKYQPDGSTNWLAVDTATSNGVASSAYQQSATSNSVRHSFHYEITSGLSGSMAFESVLELDYDKLEWTLNLTNSSAQAVTIGDLAVPFPMNTTFASPSTSVFKHSFISGNGSWIFWMRPDSVGPYLTMTTDPNTKLEYWDSLSAGGKFEAYIHSAVAAQAAAAQGSEWRQPNTSLTLAPGESKTYGFKFQWADDYDAVRQVLVDEGKIDVNVVPGMTVPTNLVAQFALRTTQTIHSVQAEFPADTQIQWVGNNGLHQIYQVQFSRLGENELTVNYGDNQQMFLEFFVTEPLETLISKRAEFLAAKQINNPGKWYDGLYPEWNMDSQTQVTPDNYDLLVGFVRYEVAADDSGLSRPAYMAVKNAVSPVQSEVDSLDRYIDKFVWGGLQRTTSETYPYGIYGVIDWYSNRNSSDSGTGGKLHLWRIYDYPHIIAMYEGMYRVAKYYPEITTSLTAQEYLQRAYGTANALFTVPDQLTGWSAYHTGLMNELVITDLIEELEDEGMTSEAATLRAHWEQKVNYFVLNTTDLFGSEYSFDSTGFETQQALARYAVEHADSLDSTNPAAYYQTATDFMGRQMAANIFSRGWLEPAYYHYGSDYRQQAGDWYTLSYMAQMGGWAVQDYALYYATNSAPYLRLAYGSYLSAWALMNTGTPDSNYGYWYPGSANDGACGGGFEPSPYNTTWLGQPCSRGSWYYSCEQNLGFCGAIRMAATLLVDDPIFGRFCYGGDWQQTTNTVHITPKDGVRQRFHVMLDAGRMHLQLENDHFADSQSIEVKDDLSQISFVLNSPNPAAHDVRLKFSVSIPGSYDVSGLSGTITTLVLLANQEVLLDLPFGAGSGPETFWITKQ